MWFSAAFQCPADNHLLEVETFQAIVDGPGLEVTCIVCHTLFLVTNEGATPITDSDLRAATVESINGTATGNTTD